MSSFQSLDRAIEILFVFTNTTPHMTAEEIAAKANLPRGSIYRYINALMENGLIERCPNSNKFQLGYKLLYFQSVIHQNDVLEDIALPYMRKIHEATSETVQLALYRDGMAIPIEAIESTASVRVAPPIGKMVPLHAGANNKVILAFRPDEEIKQILSKPVEKFTESSPVDPEQIWENIRTIRKDGYAYSCEEMHYGAYGISAPILDRNGHAIASIGVSGPIIRISDEMRKSVKDILIKATTEISDRFRFSK